MNAENLISIVLPTHNRAKMLERAIKSVIAQSYGNWELLIIDDNSNDNTQETAASYLNDKRIIYKKLQKNS